MYDNATSWEPGPEWTGLREELISAYDLRSEKAVSKEFLELLLWRNDRFVVQVFDPQWRRLPLPDGRIPRIGQGRMGAVDA